MLLTLSVINLALETGFLKMFYLPGDIFLHTRFCIFWYNRNVHAEYFRTFYDIRNSVCISARTSSRTSACPRKLHKESSSISAWISSRKRVSCYRPFLRPFRNFYGVFAHKFLCPGKIRNEFRSRCDIFRQRFRRISPLKWICIRIGKLNVRGRLWGPLRIWPPRPSDSLRAIIRFLAASWSITRYINRIKKDLKLSWHNLIV